MILRVYLKKARNLKGVTQREAAEHLGIATVNYQNIEASRSGTSEENWIKLYEYYDRKIPLQDMMKNV